MTNNNKQLIGRTILVTINGVRNVPAKVDTGADSSSIWVSDIQEADGALSFVVFAAASSYFTGQRITLAADFYERTRVASSSGHRQARYAVELPVEIAGVRLQARFTLANRETMVFPVLLGRDILDGRFLVDVTQGIPVRLQEELKAEQRLRVRALRLAKKNVRIKP